MTNVELKAAIDTAITSETAAQGITPEDVGGKMKQVVDYVDQEVQASTDGMLTFISTNIFGSYGAFSDESETAPYPYLNNKVNYLVASGSGHISLPETSLVGFQIIVITAFSKLIYPAPDGSGTILNLASNTGAGGLNMLQNRTYRFTYLGLHLDEKTWTCELLGL